MSGLVAVGVMFKRGGYLVQVHLAMVTTVMTMVTLVVAGFTRGVAELQASASANVLRSTLTTTSAAKNMQCRQRGPMMVTIGNAGACCNR